MADEKIKVLVVDDEETVRLLFQRLLQAAGYDAVIAADGEEALSVIANGDINVVLLDVKMPGLSGIDVLRRISTDWPNLCVIMATAVADVETGVETMKLGAYDYITKPFDQDEALFKIRRAIEKWQERFQDKQHLLQLEQNINEQTRRMQEQFTELVNSLGREHQLLSQLAAKQKTKGKSLLAGLPPELQGPISTVKEFRDALLRILRRS